MNGQITLSSDSRCDHERGESSYSKASPGRNPMLQWNTRLLALIVFVVLLAALVGDLESAGGFQYGW